MVLGINATWLRLFKWQAAAQKNSTKRPSSGTTEGTCVRWFCLQGPEKQSDYGLPAISYVFNKWTFFFRIKDHHWGCVHDDNFLFWRHCANLFSPTTVQSKMYLISKVSIAVLSIEVTSCIHIIVLWWYIITVNFKDENRFPWLEALACFS